MHPSAPKLKDVLSLSLLAQRKRPPASRYEWLARYNQFFGDWISPSTPGSFYPRANFMAKMGHIIENGTITISDTGRHQVKSGLYLIATQRLSPAEFFAAAYAGSLALEAIDAGRLVERIILSLSEIDHKIGARIPANAPVPMELLPDYWQARQCQLALQLCQQISASILA